MAATAAEQNYQDTNKFIKASANTIIEMMTLLADFLEKQAKFAPQREFAKWIKKNGECHVYEIEGPAKYELIEELKKREIPYLELTNNPNKIIIKGPDAELIQGINRAILIGKITYFQEVDASEMENAVASIDAIKDKEILSLHGLSNYDVEIIKNKCNNITRGFMVGTEKDDDGTYTLSVMAEKVFSDDPSKPNDFCKAYLASLYSHYAGEGTKEIKEKQIDYDKSIESQVFNRKGEEKIFYVVDPMETDPKHIIEVTSMGFERYESRIDENGQNVRTKLQNYDINDINYDSELQKALDTMRNKKILETDEELTLHITTDEQTLSNDRPVNSYEQKLYGKVHDEIVDKIDLLIKNKVRAEGLTFKNSNEAFSFYVNEATNIINDVHTVERTSDYPPELINHIKQLYKEKGLEDSHDAKSYKDLLSQVNKTVNAERHQAKKKVVEKKEPRREDYGSTDR